MFGFQSMPKTERSIVRTSRVRISNVRLVRTFGWFERSVRSNVRLGFTLTFTLTFEIRTFERLLFGFRRYLVGRSKFERNDDPLTEIRTCSDFGRSGPGSAVRFKIPLS